MAFKKDAQPFFAFPVPSPSVTWSPPERQRCLGSPSSLLSHRCQMHAFNIFFFPSSTDFISSMKEKSGHSGLELNVGLYSKSLSTFWVKHLRDKMPAYLFQADTALKPNPESHRGNEGYPFPILTKFSPKGRDWTRKRSSSCQATTSVFPA